MKKKKEDRFEYKVPYDVPIYWATKPTEQDLENVKKTMIGLVEFVKLEARLPQKSIIKDVECVIDFVPCIFKEGYTIRTHTEFSFWCYYDHMGGKIYTREVIGEEE